MSQGTITLILWIILAIALFFMMREVFCWYFKLNSIESLLKDIKELLTEEKQRQASKIETDKK